MNIILRTVSLIICITIFVCGCSGSVSNTAVSSKTIDAIQITSFPEQIDSNCRGGKAKIFDECSDQVELFNQAKLRAEAEDKTLMVSYGAEWCIWCHVFEAYINGDVEKFTYTYGSPGDDERDTHTMRERAKRDVSQEAHDIKKFVSENFVIVHIDYEHSPDGNNVLSKAQALDNYSGAVPYIFTVDAAGKYAAELPHFDAEVRRDTSDWYRGYDRVRLLEQFKSIR